MCGHVSRSDCGEKNHCIKLDNKSFEMLEQLKYLGKTVTNQNSIQEEIKGRSNHGMCVIIRRTSSLLSENTKINLLKPNGYVMHQQFNVQQL
jgi:hypothetical protein